MRQRFSSFTKCDLFALDSAIGKVVDLLIEDSSWNIRYLVVSIQNTFPRRRVLVSPATIQECNFYQHRIDSALDSQQIIKSPRFASDQPISREYEEALVDYYGWPIYWLGRSTGSLPLQRDDLTNEAVCETGTSKLRSAAEICGYELVCSDGPVGHIEDLLVHMDSWMVELASVKPSSFWHVKSRLFSTAHVDHVNWNRRRVLVDLTREVFTVNNDDHQPRVTGEPYSAEPFRTLESRI